MVILFLVMDQKVYQEILLEKSILTDELFAKVLQRSATCLLVNNNLCRKLISSLEFPNIFDDDLKTTSVSFFSDFNVFKL